MPFKDHVARPSESLSPRHIHAVFEVILEYNHQEYLKVPTKFYLIYVDLYKLLETLIIKA